MLTIRAGLSVVETMSSVVFISAIAAMRPTGPSLAYEASQAALSAVMAATATEGRSGRSASIPIRSRRRLKHPRRP